MRKGYEMGFFKQKAIEDEVFVWPQPKRVADLGVEPMPYYDRPRVVRALEALEWARIATPGVTRRAEVLFLVQSLSDQGADSDDFDALIAFGVAESQLAEASELLGVEF